MKTERTTEEKKRDSELFMKNLREARDRKQYDEAIILKRELDDAVSYLNEKYNQHYENRRNPTIGDDERSYSYRMFDLLFTAHHDIEKKQIGLNKLIAHYEKYGYLNNDLHMYLEHGEWCQ